MRELSTINKAQRILNAAGMDNYGDGYIVTDLCVGYAEPGYGSDEAVIAFGNWNDKRPAWGWQVRTLAGDRFSSAPNTTKADTLPSHLARALETAGVEVEWCDEWVRCGDCYRAFRSQGDSYSWTMHGAYSEDGCDYYCADCLRKDPESLLEDYVNNPKNALTFLGAADLMELGFTQENGTYENGWHEGQNDDPTAILERILKFAPEGTEVVFTIPEVSQFYIRFTAWVRTPETDTN